MQIKAITKVMVEHTTNLMFIKRTFIFNALFRDQSEQI